MKNLFRPGFPRAVLGLVIGILLGIAFIAIVRAVMGLDFASGPAAIFGGFFGAAGWLWGIGSFNSHSMEHNGLEHLSETEPGPVAKAAEAVAHATPEIVATSRPLISPLLQGIGIVVIVTVIVMALGFVLQPVGVTKVTTDKPVASAVTPAGELLLFDTIHINKTVFFLILVVVVLGILGGLALVLALVMNSLDAHVGAAKKMAAEPLKEEPPLFRLIDFFVSWVNDILESTRKSVLR